MAPTDTDKFKADVFHVQKRNEQLSSNTTNTGRLLSPGMEQQGQLAQSIRDRFIELINTRSVDVSDPGLWKGRHGARLLAYYLEQLAETAA